MLARQGAPYLTTCDYCKSDRRHSNTQSEVEYCDKKRIREEMKFFVHFFCLLIVPFAESCVSRDLGWLTSLQEAGHEGCPTSCLAICVIYYYWAQVRILPCIALWQHFWVSKSLEWSPVFKNPKIQKESKKSKNISRSPHRNYNVKLLSGGHSRFMGLKCWKFLCVIL